uniref:Putative reverse transcriptase, RNA-dependent DNA polymerase n=1 Tax=Tanacetum cinerariifolium TaxID=118510 RepID=A0A699LA17_TANCI|nr:putative reverse transcriptase, RNA-dependent DNA polymerase [Tanacetum cinerariifolium]
MFTPVSAIESICVYLDGSIPVNAATLLNADLPIDPLMPDLEDTADIGIFDDVYDDREVAALTRREEQITKIIRTTYLLVFSHNKNPKRWQALTDPSWIEAMQEELLIEAIGLFFDYASFMGFIVYQMDVKSAFLYGIVKKDVSMIGSLMYLTASRKSTTGGCQFLRKRLISWQCKKQTVVANSTTKAKYVAAASCYG